MGQSVSHGELNPPWAFSSSASFSVLLSTFHLFLLRRWNSSTHDLVHLQPNPINISITNFTPTLTPTGRRNIYIRSHPNLEFLEVLLCSLVHLHSFPTYNTNSTLTAWKKPYLFKFYEIWSCERRAYFFHGYGRRRWLWIKHVYQRFMKPPALLLPASHFDFDLSKINSKWTNWNYWTWR